MAITGGLGAEPPVRATAAVDSAAGVDPAAGVVLTLVFPVLVCGADGLSALRHHGTPLAP